MGKTNPTYRDRLRGLREEWDPFRTALRRQHVDEFEQLFDHAQNFADAAGIQNPYDVEVAFYMSVCLAQEKRIDELERRLARVEGRVAAEEAAAE